MDPDVRLYTLGDLLEDLHDDALEKWKKSKGHGLTWRAAREKKLDRVEVQLKYSATGVAWVYVFIIGKRSSWSADYAYKAWVRPGNTFEMAATL
jgi:hypothetical protein